MFPAKYPWWHPVVRDGVFYPDGLDGEPAQIYKVTPAVAFGFGKDRGSARPRATSPKGSRDGPPQADHPPWLKPGSPTRGRRGSRRLCPREVWHVSA
jgi:hypothetical protein